jgi:hypothetical protein
MTGACAAAAFARIDALVKETERRIEALQEDHASIAYDIKVWRLEALKEARDLFGSPNPSASVSD